MIIVFKNDTKEIQYTEDNTMVLTLPEGTMEEKKQILNEQGLDFVSIPYELGVYIQYFKLSFDTTGNFIGLQPK
jgi:hypothetical protein